MLPLTLVMGSVRLSSTCLVASSVAGGGVTAGTPGVGNFVGGFAGLAGGFVGAVMFVVRFNNFVMRLLDKALVV